MIAQADLVGVRGTMRCRHARAFLGVYPTGHELTWQGLAIFRIENGRIAERWFNSDSITILVSSASRWRADGVRRVKGNHAD